MKLKYKLPLTMILLLITAFAFLWFGTQNTMEGFIMDYQHSLSLSNINMEIREIENDIQDGKFQLLRLAERLKGTDLNWDELSNYFLEELHISVFDRIGLVYSDKTYNITGSGALGSLADREYLEGVFNGNLVISDPLYSKSTGIYQIVVAAPIQEDGKVVGAVLGTIPMMDIEDKVYSLNLAGHGYGFLVNEAGDFIIHPRYEEVLSTSFFEHIGIDGFHGSNGYFPYQDTEGNKKVAFFKKLEGTKLYMVISIHEGDLYLPISSLFRKNLFTFSLILFLVLLLTYIFIKKALTPIDDLIQGMKRAEEGDYTLQIPLDRTDEIGEIAIQFNKTLEAVCLRDEELQALNEELTASFEEINETTEKLLQTYEELARRFQNEQLINALSEKLFAIKDLDEVLEAILEHTEEITNAEVCAIYRYDGKNQCFRVSKSKNYTEEDRRVTFKVHEGTIGWIVANKKELIITDTAENPVFVPKFSWSKKFSMLFQVPILDENDKVIGVMSYAGNNLNTDLRSFLKQLSKTVSITMRNSQLITEIKKTYFDIIKSLIKAIELKDSYTSGHSERVMEYSLKLGRKLKLSKSELETLKYGSILHDIGKLGVPDNVLLKPDKLSNEEYQLIKEHSQNGEAFVGNLGFLEDCLPIIRNHHERMDGRGYPDGLKGDQLSLLVRIVSIADAYDAMTSKRAYRSNFTKEQAIEELIRCKGSQFDPYLVDQFVEILSESKNS